MFTGIVTAVGHILAHRSLGDSAAHGLRLTVGTPPGYLDDVQLGDSIAINGACMTAVQLDAVSNALVVDVSAESLAKTSSLNAEGRVNLEKALRAADRLGGHIVSGHVDGVGRVASFDAVGESFKLDIDLPVELARFLAYKGSVTVHGVSLTVNQVLDSATGCRISINLIPHTVQNTALADLRPGSAVNLEIDLIARYVERMLSLEGSAQRR